MNFRNGPDARWIWKLAHFLAAAMIVSSSGCMTPQSYSLDGRQPVSEAKAKRDLGIDHLSSYRTAMAIRELRDSLRRDPSDPKTHLWLGEAYRRKGKTEEAETSLRNAIRLASSTADSQTVQSALLNLSALLSQLGRYEEALEHCEALAVDPTFSTPWRPLTNCGWSLLQLGRLDEARQHFEEALDYFPGFGPARLNLGILHARQGHPLLAIKAFERALDSGHLGSSGHGEAHYRLGEIYVGLGRREKARAHFQQATDKAPLAEWGSQSQAYLDLLR